MSILIGICIGVMLFLVFAGISCANESNSKNLRCGRTYGVAKSRDIVRNLGKDRGYRKP